MKIDRWHFETSVDVDTCVFLIAALTACNHVSQTLSCHICTLSRLANRTGSVLSRNISNEVPTKYLNVRSGTSELCGTWNSNDEVYQAVANSTNNHIRAVSLACCEPKSIN